MFLLYGGINRTYILSICPICVDYSQWVVYQGQHLTQTSRPIMVGVRCMIAKGCHSFLVLGVESYIIAELDLIHVFAMIRQSHP